MSEQMLHGMRIALLIVRMGHKNRVAARQAIKLRVAELMAVAMICDRRRVRELEDLDERHKLRALSAYASGTA